jgi:hypothetical protein
LVVYVATMKKRRQLEIRILEILNS